MMDLRNKKVTVVGLGNSGIGSVELLYREGAIVSVTDNHDTEDVRKNAKRLEKKYIDLEIGRHSEEFLDDTEILVVSPGVEKSSTPVQYALKNNIPIISELELACQFCKGPIIAVTGTNGKSTVVSLIGEVLREAGIPVNVCGNIGNSLSGETQNITKNTVAVVEVSSFQLEWMVSFRPKISVILNVTEDHLDRYSTFRDYVKDKKRIFENQKEGDITILNHDDKVLSELEKTEKISSKILYFSRKTEVEGVYLDKGRVKTFLKNKTKTLFELKNTRLSGAHNVENILVAALAGILMGAKTKKIEKAIKSFCPLPHRFEKVGTVNGVEFIDDSKATNVDSAYRALESLDKPTVLIAGGKDKNLSYSEISPMLKKKIRKIVLIGETKNKMRDLFKDIIPVMEESTLEAAVNTAYKNSSPGGCVLLSPMCSSFDMFRDYKERGEVFKRAVENLR